MTRARSLPDGFHSTSHRVKGRRPAGMSPMARGEVLASTPETTTYIRKSAEAQLAQLRRRRAGRS